MSKHTEQGTADASIEQKQAKELQDEELQEMDDWDGSDDVPPRPKTPAGELPYVMGFLMVSVLLWAFWSDLQSLLMRAGGANPPQFIGTVVKTNYVGGLGFYTQIDTPTRPYLVIGAIQLEVGTPLTLTQRITDRLICVQGSTRCWSVVGEP